MPIKPEILLGIGASIAAYKAPDVVSDLKKRGAGVTVLMTKDATRFITPLTLRAVSGRPVGVDLFDENAASSVAHIELAKAASVYVIVGATADLLAKLACGLAPDLVTACALAVRCPLLLAPAMNTAMWEHPATRANVKILSSRGASWVGPEQGGLACGDQGLGRLAASAKIAEKTWQLALKKRPPKGGGKGC